MRRLLYCRTHQQSYEAGDSCPECRKAHQAKNDDRRHKARYRRLALATEIADLLDSQSK